MCGDALRGALGRGRSAPAHAAFFKAGYRLEVRVVHADDASLLVRFAKAPVSASPRPTPSAATPSGFK